MDYKKSDFGDSHAYDSDTLSSIHNARLKEWKEKRAKLLRIKFGKYRGLLIHELPSDYLKWLILKCNSISEEQLELVAKEYLARHPELKTVKNHTS